METDLLAIHPGPCHCIRCFKIFESPDKCRIRYCPRCRKLSEHEAGIRVISTASWGEAVHAVSDTSLT